MFCWFFIFFVVCSAFCLESVGRGCMSFLGERDQKERMLWERRIKKVAFSLGYFQGRRGFNGGGLYLKVKAAQVPGKYTHQPFMWNSPMTGFRFFSYLLWVPPLINSTLAPLELALILVSHCFKHYQPFDFIITIKLLRS